MLKKIITAALQPLESLPILKSVKKSPKEKEKKDKEPTNEKPN
jgi:hypothetical protein